MGTLVGHVAPGFGFFVIGLWHLLNHIKLHVLNYPKHYTSLPWFPTSRLRYLELFLIMGGSSMSIAIELFISTDRHQPLDPDGTIPSYHLHNFEHSSMAMTFIVYGAFALILDKFGPKVGHKAQNGLTLLLASVAFAQQLLLFHLHSTDHMGVEGEYHLLLQIVILVSLITCLMGIGHPKSFFISFVRSLSILLQGLWLMVMGFMLWTPQLMPKGCFMNLEDGHQVVRCHDHESLERAKSLVNLEFSWYLVILTVSVMVLYLVMFQIYGDHKVEYYRTLSNYVEEQEEEVEEEEEDVEAQKKGKVGGELKSFIQMGKKSKFSNGH